MVFIDILLIFIYFFSSRRRHTRYWRDWSSDVCSSDLPARPVVCFDETSKQLVAETRTPLPMAPGVPERVDYEYERNGVANLFLVTQPRGAWRHVDVTDRRTKHDFAHQMRDLVDRHFPDAERIRVVLDNLNTHTPAALYEAFAPAEARRVLRRLELHYTPVHGSWLNMAELEFSLLSRQCRSEERRVGKECR